MRMRLNTMILRKCKIPALTFAIGMFVLLCSPLTYGGAERAIDKDVFDVIRHGDRAARQRAVRTLRDTRPVTQEIVSALTVALEDKSELVRREAVLAVAKIGPDAKDAVPTLLTLLKSKRGNQLERIEVPLALSKIGPVSTDVIPALIRIVEDKNDNLLMRARAIVALGNIRPPAQDASTALLKIAKEDDLELLQIKAWEALVKIQPDNQEAVNALVEVAKGKMGREFVVRQGVLTTGFNVDTDALITLVEIGETKKALPILINALGNEDRAIRASAATLLGKIGPAAKPAIPALLELLRSESPRGVDRLLKRLVIGVLIQIDPTSEPVVSTMKDVEANDPDPEMRKIARKFLERFQREK